MTAVGHFTPASARSARGSHGSRNSDGGGGRAVGYCADGADAERRTRCGGQESIRYLNLRSGRTTVAALHRLVNQMQARSKRRADSGKDYQVGDGRIQKGRERKSERILVN